MRKLYAAALTALLLGSAAPDEGMWLYNQVPLPALERDYGFTPSPQWLEHLMRSSVRFNAGGSGSLVSDQGLVMTNHHVAAEALQKLSTPQRDLLKNGFCARRPSQELPCLDMELDVLESIEDISERVGQAIPEGPGAEEARRGFLNTLEQQESQKSGLHCEAVTLFRGGAYHLYRYRRYTDVRLVFAPETAIAFFGGDSDNFEYPRQCLDVTFFRIYDQGRPLRPRHHLDWSRQGVQEGDLVLVSGHPARTNRLNTLHHLTFLRDVQYPMLLNLLRRREVLLTTYGQRSDENRRQSQDDLFGVQNSRKARLGGLQGLQDPRIMLEKQKREENLRSQLSAEDQQWWQKIDQSLQELRRIYPRYLMLEQARAFQGSYFRLARLLVRRADELQRPNSQRLREFSDARQASLEQELHSSAPIYPALEQVELADSLALMVETLGAEDPAVLTALAGKSPIERAQQCILGSQLGQKSQRIRLSKLTPEELRRCGDPMIELAASIDAEARQLRNNFEKHVAEPQEQAYSHLARAALARPGGANLYPDATFTLRLAYGKVMGFGSTAYTTDLSSLFAKEALHGGKPPFQIPARWHQARPRLNLKTPYNFLCTADIIGGNSGSPVVNRRGEVVGLIFDGNLDSLVWDFLFSDRQGRALAVDTRAILVALRQIYDMNGLAEEIAGKPEGGTLNVQNRHTSH